MPERRPAPRGPVSSPQKPHSDLSATSDVIRRAAERTAAAIALGEANAARLSAFAARCPKCRRCKKPLTQGQAGIHASCSVDEIPQREAWPDKWNSSRNRRIKN